MEIPTLETARLVLRPFAESDAGPLCRILSEKGILRYFPNPDPPPLDKVQRLVAHQLEHWAEHGLGWWAVEPRQDPELIGWCGLQFLPDLEEVEVGYLLSRAYWGHGLTTEAASASVQHGFEQLELAKIIALAHPENIASRRVAEKLGMRLVGLIQLWGLDLCRYEVGSESFGEGGQIDSIKSRPEGLGGWDVHSHPNGDTAVHVPSTQAADSINHVSIPDPELSAAPRRGTDPPSGENLASRFRGPPIRWPGEDRALCRGIPSH